MDFSQKLDYLKQYMHFRTDLLAAIHFKYHQSAAFPSIDVRTTLWESQIPTFEEFCNKKVFVTYNRPESLIGPAKQVNAFHGIEVFKDEDLAH